MDRREMLGMVGAGAVGLTALSAQAADPASETNAWGLDKVHADCLKACSECAQVCDLTFHHCYREVAAGNKEHARSLHLTSDCAGFCTLSAHMIAKHSSLMAHSCDACAEACKATAAEVGKFDSKEMKAATAMLLSCEKSCRTMVANMAVKTG